MKNSNRLVETNVHHVAPPYTVLCFTHKSVSELVSRALNFDILGS